jgi:polysaccharide export outer membrane protein
MRIFKHFRYVVAVMFTAGFAFSAGAQSRPVISKSTPPTPSAPVAVQPAADYVLHINDSLEIQFPFSPEYNESVIIQPDGQIGLREASSISIAGKTVAEVSSLIAESYKGILNSPKVSILLKNFLVPSFYATGEVGKPGRYELRSDTTLLQALSESGGLLNERAKKTQVVIFRPLKGGGVYESHLVDVKALLDHKDGHFEDRPIYPGDIIYVPQNRYSKIERYLPTMSLAAYAAPF